MARLLGTIALAIALSTGLGAAQLTVGGRRRIHGIVDVECSIRRRAHSSRPWCSRTRAARPSPRSRARCARVQKVTDVTKKGNDLVLKFAGNFQGNPFDAMITLTPDGTDKCKVTFDINGGQFTMSGTGTKK